MDILNFVRVGFFAAAVIIAAPSFGQIDPFPEDEESDFIAVNVHFNPIMQPKQWGEVLEDCNNSSACKSVIEAAAAYVGIPPGSIDAAVMLVAPKREGEETRVKFEFPPPYEYCRTRVHLKSITPYNGARGSIFKLSTNKRGISAYTWTPKQCAGCGRSWVDADITLIGVHTSKRAKYLADRTCKKPGGYLLNCRGSECPGTIDQ